MIEVESHFPGIVLASIAGFPSNWSECDIVLSKQSAYAAVMFCSLLKSLLCASATPFNAFERTTLPEDIPSLLVLCLHAKRLTAWGYTIAVCQYNAPATSLRRW